MNGYRNWCVPVIGAVCGAVVALWGCGPVAIAGLIVAGCVGLRWLVPDAAERHWVGRWLAFGLAVRLILAMVGMAYAWHAGLGSDLFGDARAYSYSGNYIAEVLRGEPLPARYVGNDAVGLEYLREINRGVIPPRNQYQVGGMGYVVGWFYAVFGHSPLTVKWFNVCLGVLTAGLLYDLVRRMAGVTAARVAMLLVLWWPSMLLWSVTGLKDAIATIGLLVPIWLMVRGHGVAVAVGCLLLLVGERVWPLLMLMGVVGVVLIRVGARQAGVGAVVAAAAWVGLFGLMAVRYDIARLVSMATVLGALALMPWRWKRSAIILAAVALVLLMGLRGPELVNRCKAASRVAALRLVTLQTSGSRYEGTMYRVYPRRFLDTHPYYERTEPLRAGELGLAYVRGMIFLLFAPFPWRVENWAQWAAWPQTVVSYWLWLPVVVGLGCWLQSRWRETAVVLLVCGAVASVYALTLWNVGSTMRLRDIMTPYALALAATGLAQLMRGVWRETDGGRGNTDSLLGGAWRHLGKVPGTDRLVGAKR